MKPRFDSYFAERFSNTAGASVTLPRDLKRLVRVVEKVFSGGRADAVLDILRCMIVVDDLNIAAHVLNDLATDPNLKLLRIKDRFL